MSELPEKFYIPADSTTFANHPEGEPIPAIITGIRDGHKGRTVVFKTSLGYAGKSYMGDYAKSYAEKTCSTFGVGSMEELIGKKAFATFLGNPCFAYDLVPALAIELDNKDQHFLKTGEV